MEEASLGPWEMEWVLRKRVLLFISMCAGASDALAIDIQSQSYVPARFCVDGLRWLFLEDTETISMAVTHERSPESSEPQYHRNFVMYE